MKTNHFLPLALIAGIYGMNFEYMPELKVPWAYFAVLGFMGAVGAVIIWWFWARKWFTRGRRIIRRKLFFIEPERLSGYMIRATKRHHHNKKV